MDKTLNFQNIRFLLDFKVIFTGHSMVYYIFSPWLCLFWKANIDKNGIQKFYKPKLQLKVNSVKTRPMLITNNNLYKNLMDQRNSIKYYFFKSSSLQFKETAESYSLIYFKIKAKPHFQLLKFICSVTNIY